MSNEEFGALGGGTAEPYNYRIEQAMLAKKSIRVRYREQLEAQKKQHDQRSAEIARALEILEKYPEIEELLTIVGRGL